MKLAVVGKGGVGKTTLTALLAQRRAALGHRVIAVDADPDGNLPAALGCPPDQIPAPIAQMRDLVLERTGAKDGGAGLMFRLNPEVRDLPERFAVRLGGVRLLVLGTVEVGGKGCMCPEGTLLKALMQHLLLQVTDDVILDMEAGLEHVGRARPRGVDAMIAVVEPGMRSVQTAARVEQLARDIGIRRTLVVLNKIRDSHQREVLQAALRGQTIVGELPYSTELAQVDLDGKAVDSCQATLAGAVTRLAETLEQQLGDQPAMAL